MGTKHRTPEQMLEHRAQAAQWHKEGWSNQDIAEALGIAEYTVCRDLAFVRAQLMAKAIDNMDAKLNAELEKINLIEQEAWEQWELSKKERTTQTATKGSVNKNSLKIETRGADPRYMETIRWCSEQRAKLLGMVVNKVDMTSAGKPMQQIQLVEVRSSKDREQQEQTVLH